MQYIAQSGNIQLLRYAIECKENTDIYTTHANETILHVACDTGNIEVIRYLIRYRGIESSIRDNVRVIRVTNLNGIKLLICVFGVLHVE